jgi:hypothetical protein
VWRCFKRNVSVSDICDACISIPSRTRYHDTQRLTPISISTCVCCIETDRLQRKCIAMHGVLKGLLHLMHIEVPIFSDIVFFVILTEAANIDNLHWLPSYMKFTKVFKMLIFLWDKLASNKSERKNHLNFGIIQQPRVLLIIGQSSFNNNYVLLHRFTNQLCCWD